MRRASKIALLAVGGSALLLFSAAAAFLVGHGVGADERLAVNRATREREQSVLAAGNMTKAAFQAWSLVCRDGAGNERRCVLFIAVADPDEKKVLLTLSIARTPKGMPVLVVDTPAGVTVDAGITVTAGRAEAITVPIQSCAPQRCRAVTELTPSLRAALETADVTSVSYMTADSKQSNYNLPTRGFRDGLTAWSAGGQSKSAAVN